jgi:integrase/lambda repressor-like predicted transcriptional regulator
MSGRETMSLQDVIRQYLNTTGQSMRALSLQAGLYPRAVSDILNRQGHRPGRKIIDALSDAMGVSLPDVEARMTYAVLIARLSTKTGNEQLARKHATRVSRIRKVLEVAGWVPELEEVDRRRVVECFARWSPASLGLTTGSFHNYKSDVLAAIEDICGHNRKRGIRDASSFYREIHESIIKSKLPKDMKLSSGSFLVFLEQSGLLPSEVTRSVLERYYFQRCAEATKTERACRKHTKRVAALCSRLSCEPAFAEYRFAEVDHPFDDARDKYGVPASMLGALTEQFDGPVTRWAMGLESREGLSYEDFLAGLDRVQPDRPLTGKLALLKPRRHGKKQTEEDRRSAGFLVDDETWSERTVGNRRGMLIAGAKALYASTGYLIETVEEYTDPLVVESVLEAITAGNSEAEYPTSYASTLGKAIKKLARDYVGRDEQEIIAIAAIIKDYKAGGKGITKRNKAKLRQIVGERQQRLLDLGDILIDEVNAKLDKRSRNKRAAKRLDQVDSDMARDIMCVLASDILLARAPRKANLIGIKLSWISWRANRATITVPNVEVKMRTSDDPDLPIPLGEHESRRLRLYLDKIRPMVLRDDDKSNPYLFPSQGTNVGPDEPFTGLLERLMRHTSRITGIRMNPHLYRHFLGWLWLKEDPDRLPDVQRLLGHKSLETTLEFYAEIDENLALDRWQAYLTDKKSQQPKGLQRKANR